MKSSSLRMIDAGIPDPRDYRDSVIHDWNLSDNYVKHLQVFIIRESTPAKLFLHLKDGELKIKQKYYSVIWVNPPETVREAEIVLVSLRFCKFLDRGYALVKILKGDGKFEELEY